MRPPRVMPIWRRRLAVCAGPAVFVALVLWFHPVPENPAVGRTLALAAWMAVYWMTEAVPMAATALLPVVVLPAFHVMAADQVASAYINDLIFLFIGGFLLAIAMQEWGLHRRVALRILVWIGRSPSTLLLGVMGATWMISWWASNTATTLMMLPIVMALAAKLEERSGEDARGLTVALLLGVAYAASIGGMATLIGTPPNIVFSRVYALSFPEAPAVTFLTWMAVAAPIATTVAALTYVYLRARFLRRCSVQVDRGVIRDEQRSLGRVSFEESLVFAAFVVFVVLVVTRADVAVGETTVRGWASRVGLGGRIGDGAVAIASALALFVLPSRSRAGFVLERPAIAKLPWDIVLLFGGGFALAEAFQASGASQYLGERLAGLSGAPPIVVLFVVCTLVCFASELASNVALTQVILPVLVSLSSVVAIHPLFLMVPATLAASCGFMLPVATPPNAIVFGTHRIRVSEMVRAGYAIDWIGILVVTIAVYTWGRWVLGVDLGGP